MQGLNTTFWAIPHDEQESHALLFLKSTPLWHIKKTLIYFQTTKKKKRTFNFLMETHILLNVIALNLFDAHKTMNIFIYTFPSLCNNKKKIPTSKSENRDGSNQVQNPRFS